MPFQFQGRDQVAVLSQPRLFSVSRLYSKMGELDEEDLARIREGLGSCIANRFSFLSLFLPSFLLVFPSSYFFCFPSSFFLSFILSPSPPIHYLSHGGPLLI